MVAVLDLAAKTLLVLVVLRVAADPAWGNLEGKAPGTRVATYPLLAFVLPVVYLSVRPARAYPWLADLLLTAIGFSDILGNRLDLYDRVWWFDDVTHLASTGFPCAAVLILTGDGRSPLARRVERSIAVGLTASVVWELWEYYAFVTRSGEVGTAYADTVGDLALGWLGSVAAGVAIGVHLPPRATAAPTNDTAGREHEDRRVRWG